ncbi:ATP synthase subunit I [Thalassobaculum sp.]|uniref:ATP synthase subunit I n=1 Tax=Thalassobaculum sp. TaxID=2022740 RepID=UPI0032EB6AE0
MNEAPALLMAWVAGGLLGGIFFGGLWWTIRKGLSSDHPALWFLGSMLLRTGAVLSGFYLVFDGHWPRLLLCLLGFFMAKLVVMRLTRPEPGGQAAAAQEAGHAPQPR